LRGRANGLAADLRGRREGDLNMPIETERRDPIDYFESADDERLYLEAAFEDGDPAVIAAAFGEVARARGMAKVAEESGLAHGGGNPSLATLIKVADALGYRLTIQAKA
jgi:probable addiction module antidote protein